MVSFDVTLLTCLLVCQNPNLAEVEILHVHLSFEEVHVCVAVEVIDL